MKIVIDIPKEMHKALVQGSFGAKYNMYDLVGCVMNGILLPKGHGRLIDAEKLAKEISRAWTLWEKKGEDCYLFSDVLTPMLVSQQTIIEADKDGDTDG